MWYFSWILGLGFAVTLAVLNAMWLEIRSGRDKKL
jgi:cytochrome bd-I ubiquinol oxidase subunit X